MSSPQDTDQMPSNDPGNDGEKKRAGMSIAAWVRRASGILRDEYRERKKRRRKKLASKKTQKAREREFNSKMRRAARRRFLARMTAFAKDPFDRKSNAYTRRQKLREKHIRKIERSESRQRWWKAFRKHPLRTLFRRRMKYKGYYVQVMTRKERREAARERMRDRIKAVKEVFTQPELLLKFRNTYLTSSAWFLITFLAVYVIYQVVTIIVASSFHIPVVWNYYQLIFPLYTFSPLYTRVALVSIFAAGPIVSMMIALGSLQLALHTPAKLKSYKLLFLWLSLNGFNFFFGAYIAGFITRTEFIYTSEWLFMSSMFDIEEITLTLISITMLLVIGGLFTPLFLSASGSFTLIMNRYRRTFMVGHVLLPWLTGVVLLFLVTTPHYYLPLVLKTLSPALMIAPMLYYCNSLRYGDMQNVTIVKARYMRWSLVIIAVSLLFFYRLILNFNWTW